MRFRDFLTEWSNMSKGIRQEMESKGYKFLGAGVDQAAYLEPKTGKVLKIFGAQDEDYADDNGFTRDHLMFKHWADYCAKRKGNIYSYQNLTGGNLLNMKIINIFRFAWSV